MPEPRRAKLRMESVEPSIVQSMTDRENTEPNRFNPITERPEPKRAKLRTDKEDPRCRKSSTDTEEPSRA